MADNLFDKIDQQGKTIDQVADKLKDVSVEDLYALAKRTWDFKDYEMAQKYYNHIALLRPLEWEAPLYASLCGILFPAPAFEWEHRPSYLVRYAISTIDYIQNTAMDTDKKDVATLKALDIIISVLKEMIRIYCISENRKSFDEHAPIFKSNLIKAFVEIVKHIDGLNTDILSKKDELCKLCGEFIRDFCRGEAIPVSKDEYNQLFLAYSNIEFSANVECEKLEKSEQPSAAFLSKATVYCYEPNIHNMKKYKRRWITFASIWLVIDCILMAACIYLVIKAQYVIPLIMTSLCIGFVYNAISIVYFRLCKNKMRARSIFNQIDIVFCIDADTNELEIERKKGAAFYFCIFFIVFSFIAAFVDPFVINTVVGGGLYIGLLSAILHISAFLPRLLSSHFYYTQFILDTPNSYMVYTLRAMQKAYKGKIDSILIDPPYNSHIDYIGYKDGNYEEGYGDFMRVRLDLAYRLLSQKGFLVLNIDEGEVERLAALCKATFGEDLVAIHRWKKKHPYFDANRVVLNPNKAQTDYEYIIICRKTAASTLGQLMQPYIDESGNLSECVADVPETFDCFGTTSSAKDEIAKIYGSRDYFSTPKPVKLMKELIRATTDKDSIIMDFFAGSGTIGHACVDLNREDGGNRHFILVSNNESNICQAVTAKRLEALHARYTFLQ